jgi:hypothetical protein
MLEPDDRIPVMTTGAPGKCGTRIDEGPLVQRDATPNRVTFATGRSVPDSGGTTFLLARQSPSMFGASICVTCTSMTTFETAATV